MGRLVAAVAPAEEAGERIRMAVRPTVVAEAEDVESQEEAETTGRAVVSEMSALAAEAVGSFLAVRT